MIRKETPVYLLIKDVLGSVTTYGTRAVLEFPKRSLGFPQRARWPVFLKELSNTSKAPPHESEAVFSLLSLVPT